MQQATIDGSLLKIDDSLTLHERPCRLFISIRLGAFVCRLSLFLFVSQPWTFVERTRYLEVPWKDELRIRTCKS